MPPRGRRVGQRVAGGHPGQVAVLPAGDLAGPQLRGQNQVVGGIQPAVLEDSGSSDEETVTSRKKPSLVAEGPCYGYKMASGIFIAKSNFVLKVA
jgi:hypothetical protein